ncbi:MAG: TetR/AcrR family transcriptional regulator [Myxococcales bacterium]|nr:TetR/AcrR family transcriptional regulator [Myxococcales bacterium]
MARIAKKPGTYHHGDLRRVLLDAAVHVVEKEGVGALSLVAIAKKAGVSSGAPYHHFESREELLSAIAVEGFDLLTAAMKEGAAESAAHAHAGESQGEAELRGLGRGYMRFALAHRGHFRIMFRPELKGSLSKEKQAVARESFDLLRAGIDRCQREGTLAPGDPKALVLLSWSAIHGAAVLWNDGALSREGLLADGDSLGALMADTLLMALRRERPPQKSKRRP